MALLVLRVAVIVFSIIQALLGLRLILGFIDIPTELTRYVPTLLSVTDLLISPFIGFVDLLGMEIAGPAGAGGLVSGLDPIVVAALIGWSLIELVVVMVLGVVARASPA